LGVPEGPSYLMEGDKRWERKGREYGMGLEGVLMK